MTNADLQKRPLESHGIPGSVYRLLSTQHRYPVLLTFQRSETFPRIPGLDLAKERHNLVKRRREEAIVLWRLLQSVGRVAGAFLRILKNHLLHCSSLRYWWVPPSYS